MELVHDHIVHTRGRALAQGHVGQDLRRAADDRRARIDGGIPCDHAHLVRPENLAK